MLLCGTNGRPKITGMQRLGVIKARTRREVQVRSSEVRSNITNLSRIILFFSLESLIATAIGSGVGRVKVDRPSFSTISGRMRTRWQPLSTREDIFNGNSVDGPSIKHFHTKCLHFNGARSLTVSDSPDSVPLPSTADGANAATASSPSDSVVSSKAAIVLLFEEDERVGLTAGRP